jgi:hypothetical protein
MKRLLREPLVHFLVAGAVLVAASAFVPDRGVPRDDQIVITEGQIEHLIARFTRTWRRSPSGAELAGLIDEHVREEVAYREGTAIGLIDDDTIIRRRVRQKLEFIASDVADLAEPTEKDLEAYLGAHPEKFAEGQLFTFIHIFLDPARRGDEAGRDAHRLLESLAGDPEQDVRELGDPIMLPILQEDLSALEVAQVFGHEFARELMARPGDEGDWFGPVHSSSGIHLVRILEWTGARSPALDEVRDEVLREWENARRQDVREQFYQNLVDRYEVIVEWPEVPEEKDGS